MRPASLCLWRNRGMAVSGWIGVALAATPHAEKGRDNKPLMRAMRGGRYPLKKQPRGGKVRNRSGNGDEAHRKSLAEAE